MRKSSDFRIFLLLAVVLAALLPAVLLRELTPVNELNYMGIASDALERGSIFAFYQDGTPYADKPPLYLWLCMISVKFFGFDGAFILLFSALPFIYILYLLDRYFGADLSFSLRLAQILTICACLFCMALSFVGRMDMLFTAFIALSYVQMLRRYDDLKAGFSVTEACCNIALPLTVFAALFVKGPYALLFPLLALFLWLLLLGDLRLYFKIFRPRYFLIILALVLVWALCVLIDGGFAYLHELFVGQSAKRLSGDTGHPQPMYWYLTNIWYLAAPLSLPLLYLIYKDVRSGALRQDKAGSACLMFFISVLLVISLPSSKLEIYLLPALPFLAVYVLRALKRQADAPSLVLKVLLGLNFLPFALIFPALFFFLGRYPFLLHVAILAAALCQSAGAGLALYLLFRRNQLITSLSVFGLAQLAFVFCLGLSLNHLNPYLGVEDMAKAAIADINEGGSVQLCTEGIAKAQNLSLYDKRFVILKNVSPRDPRCLSAMNFVGRSALRSDPSLIPELLARGGYYIGDNIYVPAAPASESDPLAQ